MGALALRLVLFTGMARNDDLDYAHVAQDVSIGQFDLGSALSQPFDEVGWRFGFYLPVAGLYKLFGANQVTTLAFPLAASLLGIYFVFRIASLFGRQKAGAIAGLLWLAFPLDVNLATDLMPDGVMTAFSIGSVYFYLKGERTSGWVAWRAYVASALLLIWAIFVKPYALFTFFFLAIHLVFKKLPESRWAQKHTRLSLQQRRGLIIASLCVAVIAIGIYASKQILSPILQFNSSATDLLELFFGTHANRFRPSITTSALLLSLTPVIFISLTHFLVKKGGETKFLLYWAAFNFAFVEWGPSRPGLTYSPTNQLAGPRNFMLVFVPLIIVAGIYLSEMISSKIARNLIIGEALLMPVLAQYAKASFFSGGSIMLMSAGMLVSFAGAFGLPLISRHLGKKPRRGLVTFYTFALCVALLFPTPPDHITEPRLENQQVLQQNLKPIAAYLENNTLYPIATFSDDTAVNLNYVSNMKLGYSQSNAFSNQIYRIVRNTDIQNDEGSFYFVHYSDYRGEISGNWWKIMEEGVGMDFPVFLYRSLSPADAVKELDRSWARVNIEPSEENYFLLFGAAKNATNLQVMFNAWLALQDSTEYPLGLHSLLTSIPSIVKGDFTSQAENLFRNSDFALGTQHWFSSPGISVEAIPDAYGVDLKATIHQRLDDFSEVSQMVELQANSLYYFEITVKSDISTEILNVDGGRITDSYPNKDIYGEWTKISAIFVTPDWSDGRRQVPIGIIAGRNPGDILARNPALLHLLTKQ